jgi:hypothetical protein
MLSSNVHQDAVGPVLIAGPLADAVLAAIQELNGDVTVINRGAYLRVLVPGRCRLTCAAVEQRTQGPFRLPADLETVMASFRGRLRIDETEVVWERSAR